jgi:hypothetical protein
MTASPTRALRHSLRRERIEVRVIR